jgi:uncharacterized membrane protein
MERLPARLFYIFIFSVIFFPLSGGGMYLTAHCREGSLLYAVGAVLALTWLLLVFGLSRWATDRRLAGEDFIGAIGSTFSELRIRLAFLPVVGKLFAPKDDGPDRR